MWVYVGCMWVYVDVCGCMWGVCGCMWAYVTYATFGRYPEGTWTVNHNVDPEPQHFLKSRFSGFMFQINMQCTWVSCVPTEPCKHAWTIVFRLNHVMVQSSHMTGGLVYARHPTYAHIRPHTPTYGPGLFHTHRPTYTHIRPHTRLELCTVTSPENLSLDLQYLTLFWSRASK